MKWSAHCKSVNVAAQISSKHEEAQKLSLVMLLKILTSVRYLARQGLAVRGHTATEGNFQALLKLRCEDDRDLSNWLERKTAFISHDVQNEYLQLMAQHVLRELLGRIRLSSYYSLIGDEVTDQARQHQLGLSIRWVDDRYLVHEDFLELCLLSSGDASTIPTII